MNTRKPSVVGNKDVVQKMEALIRAVDKVYPKKRVLIWRSFLQGLFGAIGATIGLSIFLAFVTFFITQLKVVPFMKDIIYQTQI